MLFLVLILSVLRIIFAFMRQEKNPESEGCYGILLRFINKSKFCCMFVFWLCAASGGWTEWENSNDKRVSCVRNSLHIAGQLTMPLTG